MHCGSSKGAVIYVELDLVNSGKVIEGGCERQLASLVEGIMFYELINNEM